ncbi:MAG TPA: ATP-binding cassette domain-containing protein [Gemmatimonadales bacterium]|nr:ATP-binding cassette domain-containing protein [Gemmatimonadales bacterium]
MALLTLRQASLALGGPALLDDVTLAIDRGERVCLVGRNGAGKSTLLRVVAGAQPLDAGEVVRQQGATITMLPQEIPSDVAGTAFEVVSQGLGHLGDLLARYHDVSHRLATETSDALLAQLDRLHRQVEAADGWRLHHRVETVLSHLGLDPDAEFTALSGGLKRRVLLAQALVRGPDLLLLDEPTNHLDIESIDWLERFLLDEGRTLLFVTHDRAFLRHLATRIVELDRGRLLDWACDYDTFLARKEEALAAEAKQWAEFDKKLAQEEAWIRQGIQARRTRNEGRVRRLEAMREQRRARRTQPGAARMQLQEAERSGRLVIEAKGVAFAYDHRPVVQDFSTTIVRGDRVGIIGPNGSGKTTLLRLLLGELAPQAGTVRHGTGVEVAYFDQLRAQLDEAASVRDNVTLGGGDTVVFNGQHRHVMSYLEDFLFTPDRAHQPVRALSGGERNRLLLARLFTRSFNLLVLDEPTNDLDIETLDLLEELLLDFDGTLLVVSHDRDFLDHVVTSTLVLEGGGRVGEYAGGYSDWKRVEETRPAIEPAAAGRSASKSAATGARASAAAPLAPPAPKPRKLTWKEQRELEGLPERIEALETEQRELHAALADPDFYRREGGDALAAASKRLEALEGELAEAYARWETLAELAG